MNATAAALMTFVLVAATVALAGAAAYRLIPGVRRDRFVPATPAERRGISIMRWSAPQAWWQRFVEAVGRRTAPREAENISKLRTRLMWAGYQSPSAVAIFTGARFVLAAALGSIVPLATLFGYKAPNPVLMPLGLAYVGFIIPPLVLRRLASRRQDAITSALPDFLDLLTVCVEAGMSFDAALARVSEQAKAGAPLYQEVMRMNQEVRAGRPRSEALRAFAARCGVQDVTTMVSVFIQSERLGTSMGRALRTQSDTARVERRHRIEEQAHLAPLKMIFPTIIFLTPAFLLVALAPSLLGFLAMMGGGSHPAVK
jgi:tight adherence protein C